VTYPNIILGGAYEHTREYQYSEQFSRAVIESELNKSKSGDSEVKITYQKTPNSALQQLSIATLPRATKYLFEDTNIASRKYIGYSYNDDVLTMIQSRYIFRVPKLLEFVSSKKEYIISNSIISAFSLKISDILLRIQRKLDEIVMASICPGTNESSIISNLSLVQSLSI